MKTKKVCASIITAILAVVVTLALYAGLAAVLKLCMNYLLGAFGASLQLTYWQTVVFMLVCSIIGGFFKTATSKDK